MHATNQISVRSVSDALKFFEQTLAYNNGELLAEDTQPISTANTIFFAREVLNGLAMICMGLMPVSYTHLDVYKRQAILLFFTISASTPHLPGRADGPPPCNVHHFYSRGMARKKQVFPRMS